MRGKTLASFVPLAGALALCAVAARAPGSTLHTAISNSNNDPRPYQRCPGTEVLTARATGYNANFSVACTTSDTTGSTTSKACGSAVRHNVELLSIGAGGGVSQTHQCWGGGPPPGGYTAWTDVASCSNAVSAVPVGGGQGTCSTVTFTAASVGD
jgi:hypothetical protein